MDNLQLPAYPFFDFTEVGYGNAIVIYAADGNGTGKLKWKPTLIGSGYSLQDSGILLEKIK